MYTQSHTQKLQKIIFYFKLFFSKFPSWKFRKKESVGNSNRFAKYPNPNPSFFGVDMSDV